MYLSVPSYIKFEMALYSKQKGVETMIYNFQGLEYKKPCIFALGF